MTGDSYRITLKKSLRLEKRFCHQKYRRGNFKKFSRKSKSAKKQKGRSSVLVIGLKTVLRMDALDPLWMRCRFAILLYISTMDSLVHIYKILKCCRSTRHQPAKVESSKCHNPQGRDVLTLTNLRVQLIM